MKKIYKNPTILVVNVKPASILNGSPNPGIDPDQSTTTMDARRGRFSRWEEDDFEE